MNLSNVEAVEQAEKEREAAPETRVAEEKRKSVVTDKNGRDEIAKAKRNART